MKAFSYLLFTVLLVIQIQSLTLAQSTSTTPPKPVDHLSSATFSGLNLRLLGPALISGRVVDFAVDPTNRSRYFVAVASGGVWLTNNDGASWTPVFDGEGSYSIGTVVLDPKNPATVWVGSGENNSQRSVSYGDGVYRSDDGGKSWQNMGLKTSEHIAKIVIDPRNSNTVYVAAQGPLWSSGGERGLYKTTDGGKSWQPILTISENTGITDLVMDSHNPDILYAAAYQRRRHVWTLIDGGPESAIYKSTDAGATWQKLKSGLPSVDMGRIGLAISPVDNKVLYATIEAADKKGGIFRSTDYGVTWERRNEYDSTAMYYGHIYADPKAVDRIYVMGFNILVSDDGGKNLRPIGEKNKHVDNHVIWIDPKNPDYYLVGCDGGIYESFDRGANWIYKDNLPTAQFYDITVDNAAPFYHVYGGTQDNFSLGAPARTRSASGISNADWFVTCNGDGFRSQVDPEDPNTVYSESQYGGLVRFDRRTGEFLGIRPQEEAGAISYRWNWDSPFIISPHQHSRLYFASNRLFCSDDRGNSWRMISGELSRDLDRNKLPVMGKVWGPDAVAKNASTSLYGNATALTESPKQAGLIYVGTDDGLIQITEDGGGKWRKLEKFPGVPEMTYVSRLLASQHTAKTVYAAFDNHKNGDFAPYLLKSTDGGTSWSSIKGDLPGKGSVLAIAEDHINPNLLFVGTEFGLFFTIDGGQKWIALKGNFPTIAVHDLAIQRQENDLVVGTFGRGIYILDNYTALRGLKPSMLEAESQLFPTKDALLYIQAQPLGGNGKGYQGVGYFVAENPAFGATFTYYLKDSLKSRKQQRKDAQQAAEKEHRNIEYPSFTALRAEEEEASPEIILTISDANGKVVRKLAGSTAEGFHRLSWNLRYPPSALVRPPSDGDEDDANDNIGGPLVMPGSYRVSLAKRVNGVLTPLGEPQSFNVVLDSSQTLTNADREALLLFQQKATNIERAMLSALDVSNSLKSRLGVIKKALLETPSDNQLLEDTLAMERSLNNLLVAMRGDVALRSRNENTLVSTSERISRIMEDQASSLSRPTQTHLDAYKIAAQEFTDELNQLHKLVEVDLVKLEKALNLANAPGTPGRLPEWKAE